MWEKISFFGKRLSDQGLNAGTAGNASLRLDDKILITRTGAMLEFLDEQNFIELPISQDTDEDKLASSELKMHRSIYKNSEHKAILHTHAPMSISISLLIKEKSFFPDDAENASYLKEIPFVDGAAGSLELAEHAGLALSKNNVAIIRGHGVIACGKDLKEAYAYLSLVELASTIKYNCMLIK